VERGRDAGSESRRRAIQEVDAVITADGRPSAVDGYPATRRSPIIL